MKEYIVMPKDSSCCWFGRVFLVSAKNRKEAISIVYNEYGNAWGYSKKDYEAKTVEEYHKFCGDVCVMIE